MRSNAADDADAVDLHDHVHICVHVHEPKIVQAVVRVLAGKHRFPNPMLSSGHSIFV